MFLFYVSMVNWPNKTFYGHVVALLLCLICTHEKAIYLRWAGLSISNVLFI